MTLFCRTLKDAASGLRASEPTGMPTKGAAYALLAEAALHGAAYIEKRTKVNITR